MQRLISGAFIKREITTGNGEPCPPGPEGGGSRAQGPQRVVGAEGLWEGASAFDGGEGAMQRERRKLGELFHAPPMALLWSALPMGPGGPEARGQGAHPCEPHRPASRAQSRVQGMEWNGGTRQTVLCLQESLVPGTQTVRAHLSMNE